MRIMRIRTNIRFLRHAHQTVVDDSEYHRKCTIYATVNRFATTTTIFELRARRHC